jgi:general secretion pathway protein F
MPSHSFSITAVDARGGLFFRRVQAASEEAARQLVLGEGTTILRCDRVVPSRLQAIGHQFANLFAKPKSLDTVTFSQDMATLMDAGVTVKEAIHALHRQETSTAKQEVLGQVNTQILQGLSFSEALARTNAFPDLLIATVAASEETGDLATGLSRYAKHQQSLRTVRDRVVGAFVYPLLLLVVGSLVVALLLGVVVPRFSILISSSGKKLPVMSQLLLSWGQFVTNHAWAPFAMLGGMAALLILGYVQFKNPQTRKMLLKKIPGVARVVREFQHLQMYRTTAILTSRGISIHKALVYSLEFLSPDDRRLLKKSLVDMQEGIGVSTALSQTGLADVVASSMLNVAERTGAMSEMLDRIADFYERSLQRNIDIVSKLIEPILMIIFGVVIGGIVVLMYLPIFDLASSIS